MKKTDLINPVLAEVIASLGHTDMIVVADAGLPTPSTTRRVDLALTKGIPTFLETLKVILTEMYVEKAIVAAELLTTSPDLFEQLKGMLGTTPFEVIPHIEFKQRTGSACAIIRTGEFTPYANVILVSGAWGFGL
jgi:D-ribose pyranase